MNYLHLHEWDLSISQAVELQKQLAGQICQSEIQKPIRYIVGFDISVDKSKQARAVGVVIKYPEFEIVQTVRVESQVEFPYVPGLLSFREIPLLLQVCELIKSNPDLAMVDGQGIAHPRRCGLAAHLGLLLRIPTIGCAKSHLCGDYQFPDIEAGSVSSLVDRNDKTVIGAVVRTKKGVKPLFVSVENMIPLSSAVQWVLQCCQGYRLPAPTRLAHLASRGIKI